MIYQLTEHFTESPRLKSLRASLRSSALLSLPHFLFNIRFVASPLFEGLGNIRFWIENYIKNRAEKIRLKLIKGFPINSPDYSQTEGDEAQEQALLLVREVELMTGNDQVGMPVISVV